MKTKLTLALLVLTGIAVIDVAAQTCRPPLPYYCTRTCWGARAPSSSLSYMSNLNRATVHHTASSSDYNTTGEADTKPKMRAIQNYHMDVQGWSDIGYHFLVNKQGNIFSGRLDSGTISVNVRGAHDGCNTDSFGFTALGYYHTPYNNAVTTALKNSLVSIIAKRMPTGWLATGNGTSYCGTTDKVIGHRQVLATACPGDLLYNVVVEGAGFENDISAARPCP